MLGNISIRPKLILIFLLISLFPFGILGTVSILTSRDALSNAVFQKLVAVRDNRAFQLVSYFERLDINARSLAATQDVQNLRDALIQYHEDMAIGSGENYFIDHPSYVRIWENHGVFLRDYLEMAGFYDVFLLCADHGHVMFSVAREKDLGTNLISGPYKDTGLAEVWREVIKTEKNAVADMRPYGPSGGLPSVFLGAPLRDGTKLGGVIVFQIGVKEINRIMAGRAGMGRTGGSYLVGPDRRLRSDSVLDHTPTTVERSLTGDFGVDTVAVRQALSGKTGETLIEMEVNGRRQKILSAFQPVRFREINWALLSEIDYKEAYAPIFSLMRWIMGIGAIIAVVTALFGFFIANAFAGVIKRIAGAIRRFGQGDLTVSAEINQGDEIGQMASDFNASVTAVRSIMAELRVSAESLSGASEQLSSLSGQMASASEETTSQSAAVAAAAEQATASVGTVASSVEESSASVAGVAAMTEEMSSIFGNMAESSRKTSDNVRQMAKASEDVASGARSVASAIEEMTASLNDVAHQTVKASHVSKDARNRAGEVSAKVEALSQASRRIGKVVGTIKDIADQTNMLALNAAIEAAGAGDAGSGFAVVAGEVKELARQSADATGDIAGQIDRIQTGAREAAQAIADINGIIGDIADINASIAASAEEQTAAANEISRTVTDSATTIKDMANKAGESAGLVDDIVRSIDQTAQTAREVAANMDELSQGVRSAAKSAEDAAFAVQDISKNIQSVSVAARQTASGASQTNAAAEDLALMAVSLSEIVKRFKM